MDNYNYDFAKRFQHFRKRAGLTQKEAAEALGYSSHGSIYKIENGRQEVPITMIPKICEVFKCNPLELIGMKEDYTISSPEGGILMERIGNLPAASRHRLVDMVEIMVKGMEEGGKDG